MANKGTPTIIEGKKHFQSFVYEGNGGGQRVGRFVPFTDSGTIAKSCIFNRADNPKLSRTPSSNGNKKTFTISFWYKPAGLGTRRFVFAAATDTSNYFIFEFDASNVIDIQEYSGPSLRLKTNRTFEDTSKFYHFLLAVDTTQSTNSNRLKLYVDGDQITSFSVETYPSQDLDTKVNSTSYPNAVGNFSSTNLGMFGGNLAEFNLVDGTALTPSTFGLTDTSTGRWIPKSLTGITYGTNGLRLEFANTAGQTIGDDTSGNTNDFTVANLATSDIVKDTPTDLYPTLSDFQANYGGNYTEGNLKIDGSTNAQTSTGRSTLSFDVEDSTGYYFEFRNMGTASFGSNFNAYGIVGVNADNIAPSSGSLFPNGGHHVTLQEDGNVRINNAGTNLNLGSATLPKTGNTSTRDTIGCAVKGGKVWFSKNGIWGNANQGNPNSDGTPIASGLTGRFRACALCYDNDHSLQEVNFGQRSSLGGSATSDYSANNGGFFLYPPPTGFRAIKQDNLPETSKGTPGFTWIKDRDNSMNHNSYDSSNGEFNRLVPNNNSAILNTQGGVSKFLKGGVAVGDTANVNNNGASMVAWNWVANAGTTASNGNGSITSTVQANQTAGFSIVQYTGNGGNSAATIGHGLSSAPEWILLKFLDVSGNWTVYHKSVGNTGRLSLNLTSATDTNSSYFNNTSPTSSVFTVGSSFNQSTAYDYIAYCWHSVEGFSKFGNYVGNSNADGAFVFTGFKPSWVMIKSSTNTTDWVIYDRKRTPVNFGSSINTLYSNLADAEASAGGIDFLSNGFKARSTNGYNNNSSRTYVYMAFAEHPFLGNGTSPVTAQ